MTHYKTLFSDYNHGATSYIHMLSNPIASTRDAAIQQEDIDKLKEALAQSGKKTSTKLIFYGSHDIDKAIQLNHLAYLTKHPVCFIDCQRLVEKYIGETEKNLSKLIAQAGSENWILFFDEADTLFGRSSQMKDDVNHYVNQDVDYLLELLSQYPGLSILSLQEKSALEQVYSNFASVISFR